MVQTNLTGVFLFCQAAGRVMIRQRAGKIVNVTSVAARTGSRGMAAYAATKAGVTVLTQSLGAEWAKHGITVNAIAPTFVDTPQVAMLLGDPAFKAGVVSRIPLGRVGETGDLVGAVLYFASDASAFVTGQILTIDGGLTATQ
jgi:gluconate 5-dehydrogenase